MSVLSQVSMLFVLVLIGVFCRRQRYLNPETTRGVTQIVINIALPCLTLSAMQRPFAAEEMRNFLYVLVYATALLLISLAAAMLIYRGRPHARRAVLLNFALFSNNSFMGYPVIMALNPDLMIYAVSLDVAHSFFTWSVGNGLFGTKDKKAGGLPLKTLLINPNIIAAALGFGLFCAGVSLPSFVTGVLDLVGGLTTPLAMLLVGARLYGMKLSDLRDRDYHICAALRLVLFPALAYVLLTALHAAPDVRTAIVLLTAMPHSTMIANQAELYGGDHAFAARAIAYSTLLCMITVPVVSMLISM
ncbi:MAG: AEC family transporter [Clostridia bacterium]|nr:AEC family transporter [Clostridia bacterium]